ncbi:MAG: tyrosine-protein phosphatase [Acidobacteriota bacterium]
MRAFRKLSPVFVFVTSVFISLAILSVAQAAQGNKTPKCQVKNFGCVNETFYRGAQPKEQDYAGLAAMGVKTVIDLQMGGVDREQALVEAQGMKFHRIGMSDKNQPSPEQAELFLKIVNDPANQPVFVHCAGGRHRTGAMSAIYRITHDGWTAEQAFQEMKQYDFDYGMGHGSLKRYVYDYYSRIDTKGVVVTTSRNK